MLLCKDLYKNTASYSQILFIMSNNWMYFGSSDSTEEEEDEIQYDTLANKRDGDTKYEKEGQK